MHSHSDNQAFLRAIRRSPSDTSLRRIYADWLEERGQLVEAERERCVALVLTQPESPDVHAEASRRLETRGDASFARLYGWMARALRGEFKEYLVFGRQGVVEPASTGWARLRQATHDYYTKKTREY